MQITGNAKVKFFGLEDELRHPHSEDPSWQESVVMHWYDAANGIGGFHRIGHEPNCDGGIAVLWSMVFSRDGWRYKRDLTLPLTTADRPPEGFGAGSQLRFTCNPVPTWSVDDGPLTLELECRDFCPPIDTSSTFARNLADGHFEAAGVVTGRLRYEGRELAIQGHGWRDHSWGPRDWKGFLLNHRWITGTFGPRLSFFALIVQGANGDFHPAGFTIENDHVRVTNNFDIVMHLEADGLTHRGGELVYRFDDGSTTEIRFRAIDGAIFRRGTVANVDILSVAEWKGLVGYCDAEMSTNPRLGNAPVTVALRANLQDGFTRRPLLRA